MASPIVRTNTIQASDGYPLTYQVYGESGPWIVTANGLAANSSAWKYLHAYFGDRYRILCWNYRGLYRDPSDAEVSSSSFVTDHQGGVSVHASDFLALLKQEHVPTASWIGWGFGAQVLVHALSQQATDGDRAYYPEQLVLINPCYGRRPYAGVSVSRARKLAPYALGAFELWPSLVQRLVHKAASWPETGPWLKRLRIVADGLDEEAMADTAGHVRTLHVPAYLHALRLCLNTPLDSLLGHIDVPCLVVIGDRDAITRRHVAEPLARQIPGVELFVVRSATHLAPLEFPELINLRVEKFLREQRVSLSHI